MRKCLNVKIILIAFAVLGVTLSLTYWLLPIPEIKTFIPYSQAIFDKQGKLLRLSLARDERYRIYQPLGKISDNIINATILYEDQNYYQHPGVDIGALLRAFWSTYVTRERRIGGSTIVMQVARLRWHIQSNTITGKLQQIFRAIQLVRHYSKQEILEIYLNLAPYGGNIEGVTAASLIYFSKTPDKLSLPEALTLAVIPQNPNKRSPISKAGYKELLTARNILLDRWLEHYPDDNDQQKYFDLPLAIRSPESLPFIAPHFVNYIRKNISDWDHGFIRSTLDANKQQLVETVVNGYINSRRKSGFKNASVLLVNYKTMSIEAMLGSADFLNSQIQGQVNGTLAKRSPGSTLKPFVYALAMDQGLVHPMSLLKDAPRKFGGFTPENYNKQFLGPISVKQALIESRNVPAVDLQSKLTSSFYAFLQDAGITGLKEESHYGLALALGGGEVTMLELVRLYAMLANNGYLQSIKAFEKQSFTMKKTILSPEACFLVLDILKDNPPPDALGMEAEHLLKNEIAWKTGTSWAFRDAWAVGISGDYVLAVWVGNFNGKGNNSFIGRSAAGPLFFKILETINPATGWHVADTVDLQGLNLKKLTVCSTTGDLYEKHCPSTTQSWFIPGVSPIKLSKIYRQIPINKKTGLRACWHKPGITELKVYEFWPSDLLQIFQRAGLALKAPPRFEESCDLDSRSHSGRVPVITSPQASLQYPALPEDSNRIPLVASVDPDVITLHWFIDDVYVGSSAKGEPLLWKPRIGRFEARIVDDAGRSAHKVFTVIPANVH
jgi:penicillin-binding protein 1C